MCYPFDKETFKTWDVHAGGELDGGNLIAVGQAHEGLCRNWISTGGGLDDDLL